MKKNISHMRHARASQGMSGIISMPGPRVGEKRAREASPRSWQYPSSNPQPREDVAGQKGTSARSWHYPSANPLPRVTFVVVKEAHGLAKEADVTVTPSPADLLVFKQRVRQQVLAHLQKQPRAFATTFHVEVRLQKGDTDVPAVLASGSKGKGSWQRVTKDTNLNEAFDRMFAEISKRLDDWIENGSGWTLRNVLVLKIRAHKIQAFSRRGRAFMPLPQSLKDKQACINVNNEDEKCFDWAIKSALYSERKNPTRPSTYADCPLLLYERDMPFDVCDAEAWEQLNQQPINILSLDVTDMSKSAASYLQHLEASGKGCPHRSHPCPQGVHAVKEP